MGLRPLPEPPRFHRVERGDLPGYGVRAARWRYTEWDFGAKAAGIMTTTPTRGNFTTWRLIRKTPQPARK